MDIPFTQCNSVNYTSGRTKSILFIVLHYTANNGDTAQNNADYFARESVGASAHYFVDENGAVQSVADSDTAWHCGTTGTYKHDTCRNANAIGIEMCSRKDSDGNYYILDDTVANAVELTKSLMDLYGIDTDHIIRHYDVTGKSCPAPWVSDTAQWDAFLNTLTQTETEEEEMRYNKVSEMPGYAHVTIKKLIDAGHIQGSGTVFDEDNRPADVDLSLDMIRSFVINDRAGVYDKS